MNEPKYKKNQPTACGRTIVVSWSSWNHIKDAHPDVLLCLTEAIGKASLPTDGSELEVTIDMGRPIGHSGLVRTLPVGYDEQTTFAVRNGRRGPSRVVVGGKSPQVTTVGLIAMQAKGKNGDILPDKYFLISAWIGTANTMPEPWDKSLEDDASKERAVQHWSTQAFVYDPATMGDVFMSSWHKILTEKEKIA